MHPINQPEVMVAFSADKFSADRELTDQTTIDLIGKLLAELVVWTRKIS
jgi:hypothetical protein